MKLLILCFFFTLSLFANNLKNIDSFQASFKQSIINSSNKEIVYTGKIYIKKPLQIVWQYNEPIEKFVYILNSNVTIIEPELEQAIISKLDKEFNILHLLDNAKKISPSEYLSTFNNIQYKLTIIDNILQSISYKDNIDNNIVISFSKISQNQPILDKIFEFHIPQDYDIIRK
jgi:outer membrane lipoprotein carrier protein